MSDTKFKDQEGEVESALLDADLFLKYGAPARAVKRLHKGLEAYPRSVQLRERLRTVCASNQLPEEAARQCLALASLYIEREDFETARERLLEAKQLDPRISIASGLEAIRRARRPDLLRPSEAQDEIETRAVTLAGDLSAVSIFDAVQVIENSKLTGALLIASETQTGRVLFNAGRIVGAETEDATGEEAFRKLVEVTSGTFDFERSTQEYAVEINAASNTNLILDSLRQFDEENM